MSTAPPPPYQQLPQQPQPIVQGQYQAVPIIQNANSTDPQPLLQHVQVVVATPMGPGVVGVAGHVEPAHVSWSVKATVLVSWICLAAIMIGYAVSFQQTSCDDDDSQGDDGCNSFRIGVIWWMVYLGLILVLTVVLVTVKWPKSITLSPTCVVLSTRCTSFSVPYERISRVEIVPSVCCWCGAAGCDKPRGGFTSYTNGIYFRSPDCGQSLAFSPEDLNRLVAELQRSPLANRIFQA